MEKPPFLLTFLLPRLRDILFVGVLFSVLVGGPKLFSYDGDLGRHLTVGNYILNTRKIPTTDIFSHTVTGAEFVPHEWLSEVLQTLVYQALGLNGIVLLTGLLAAGTILLIYYELLRRGAFRLTALLVAVAVTAVASVHWLARPHMFTFFLLALWTFLLERAYANEEKKLWLFPLIMLIWANLHGAFFVGFVILGAYFAGWLLDYLRGLSDWEAGRRLVFIAGSSIIATLLNPSGWRLWSLSVGYAGNEFITSRIVDHLSPNFHEVSKLPFLFMIVAAMLALAGGFRLKLRESFLLAGWIALGLHTVRNIPLFAVVTAPIYGIFLQALLEKIPAMNRVEANLKSTESHLRGQVWIVATTLLFGLALWRGIPFDAKSTGNVFLPQEMPVRAVDWLEQNPQEGNMFNEFAWGGYILFRQWPDTLVFIDGQADVYGEKVFGEYLDVIDLASNWQDVLDRYDVAWMLIPKNGYLARHLIAAQSDEWRLIYSDDTAVIFRR